MTIDSPLFRASVYIISSPHHHDEHAEEMRFFIEALGGQVAGSPYDATHALWVGDENAVTPHVEHVMLKCQHLNVAIVDGGWLQQMSVLEEDQHWSDIDITPFIPAAVYNLQQRPKTKSKRLTELKKESLPAKPAEKPKPKQEVKEEDLSEAISQPEPEVKEKDLLEAKSEDPPAVSSEESGLDEQLALVLARASKTSGPSSDLVVSTDYKIDPPGATPFREAQLVPIAASVSPQSAHVPIPEQAGGQLVPAAGRYNIGVDTPLRLGTSISETFYKLTMEDPEKMEQDEIARAIELSVLDYSIVSQENVDKGRSAAPDPCVYETLGVTETAKPAQIRSAYRKKALQIHPDKGGCANEFANLARAYRSLLESTSREEKTFVEEEAKTEKSKTIHSTAYWDNELQDHRKLVEDMFAHHGAMIDVNTSNMAHAVDSLGLVTKDAGAFNRNEQNQRIANSCFYLSLASSYLRGVGALVGTEDDDPELKKLDKTLIGETALQLKRTIESAVVKAHPEWAHQGMVGEEVQAFSDFLVYTLESSTLLSEWAIVVFDSTSGFVDVYKGTNYSSVADDDKAWGKANTLTLKYTPGHYQALVPSDPEKRSTLNDILTSLDKEGVFYAIVDGAG